MQVPLGLAHDPRLRGHVEIRLPSGAGDELGRAAPDVDDKSGSAIVRISLAGRAEERQLRFVVTAQDVGLEAVALANRFREILTVRRVTHRARQDGDSLVRAVALDVRRVLVEGFVHPLDALLAQRSVGIDAGAEPSHDRTMLKLPHNAAILDIRDQQAGRVASDVGDGDAHGVSLPYAAPHPDSARSPGVASAGLPARQAGSRRPARPSAPVRPAWRS